MISNLVHEAFDYVQYAMYREERNLAGISDEARESTLKDISEGKLPRTDCYDGSSSTLNYLPVLTRIVAVPIVVIDPILEGIRPLFLVVESVVFTALSVFTIFWNALRFDIEEVGKSTRITLLNIHDVIYHAAQAPGRIVAIPFFIIAQLFKVMADPRFAEPSTANFGTRKPSPEVIRNLNGSGGKTKEGMLKRSYHLIEEKLYKAENQLAYSVNPDYDEKVRGSERFTTHPILSRVCAIPLAAVDVVLEVVKPAVATIASLALAALSLTVSTLACALLPFLLPYVFIYSDEIARVFNYGFYQLDEAITSLAETVANVALSPVTFVAQLLRILWDPKSAKPSRVGLYEPHYYDTGVRFGDDITRTKTTGVDQFDWHIPISSLVTVSSKAVPSFLKENYNYNEYLPKSWTLKNTEDALTKAILEQSAKEVELQ